MSRKAHPETLRQIAPIIEHYNRIAQGQGLSRHEARLDAEASNFLALELEQMRSRVYEVEYAERKSRRFLPVSSEVDTGAEFFAYEETDWVGRAKVIDYCADDVPTVETSGRKYVHKIVGVADSFKYTIQDIRRAAFAGKSLNDRKARAARAAWEFKIDEIAALGAPDEGIPSGFLNHASVGVEPLANPGTWDGGAKTPEQVLEDLNALVSSMVLSSLDRFTPNTLLLPLSSYMYISQTCVGTNDRTILELFLAKNPMITLVDHWTLLETAGAGGLKRAVAYQRDSLNLELQIPQEFEILPPQPQTFAFEVICHGRTAGTTIFQPLAVRYMDGM